MITSASMGHYRKAVASVMDGSSYVDKMLAWAPAVFHDEEVSRKREKEDRKHYERVNSGFEFHLLATALEKAGDITSSRVEYEKAAERFIDGSGAAERGLPQTQAFLLAEASYRRGLKHVKAGHMRARAVEVLRATYKERVEKTCAKKYQRGLKKVLSVVAPAAGIAGAAVLVLSGPAGWAFGAAVTVTGFSTSAAYRFGTTHLNDAVELIMMSELGADIARDQDWTLPSWVSGFEKEAREIIAKMMTPESAENKSASSSAKSDDNDDGMAGAFVRPVV